MRFHSPIQYTCVYHADIQPSPSPNIQKKVKITKLTQPFLLAHRQNRRPMLPRHPSLLQNPPRRLSLPFSPPPHPLGTPRPSQSRPESRLGTRHAPPPSPSPEPRPLRPGHPRRRPHADRQWVRDGLGDRTRAEECGGWGDGGVEVVVISLWTWASGF